MKHVLAIDSSNLIHRLYHATEDARIVPDIFLDQVETLVKKYEASVGKEMLEVILAFDSELYWRKIVYEKYKSSRPEKAPELIEAIKFIEDYTKKRYKTVKRDYFEGEDCIYEIVQEQKAKGFGCCMVSSDKDLFSMVDDEHMIFVYDPVKKVEIKEADVFAKFGVWPKQMIDYLSLVGDSSDDVPGCPGIGKVTAQDLLTRFESIKGIYDALSKEDTIVKPGTKQKLLDNIDLVRISYKIVSLKKPSESKFQKVEDEKIQDQSEKKSVPEKMTVKSALFWIFENWLGVNNLIDISAKTNGVVFTTQGISCPIEYDTKTFLTYVRKRVQCKNPAISIASGENVDGSGICFIVTADENGDFANPKTETINGKTELEAIIKAAIKIFKSFEK